MRVFHGPSDAAADHVPFFATALNEVPSPTNRPGAEAGGSDPRGRPEP